MTSLSRPVAVRLGVCSRNRVRGPGLDLNSLAASMSVQEWIALVLGSADESGGDPRVPRLPPARIQTVTNNRHGLKTLEGAAKLYAFVAREVRLRFADAQGLR